MFIFREQFEMTAEERTTTRDTSVFIVMLYVEACFTAPHAEMAPNHDLQFLKKLHQYKSIDKKVSIVAVEKCKNHLWYLNPESAAMAFFDESVLLDVKRCMVRELNKIGDIGNVIPKRVDIKSKDIAVFCEKEMDNFVTWQTRNFFVRFGIKQDFLPIDPTLWSQTDSYQAGLTIVRNMKVVNDVAERGVHLFTESNQLLTKDEAQKQFAL